MEKGAEYSYHELLPRHAEGEAGPQQLDPKPHQLGGLVRGKPGGFHAFIYEITRLELSLIDLQLLLA